VSAGLLSELATEKIESDLAEILRESQIWPKLECAKFSWWFVTATPDFRIFLTVAR